MSVGTAEALLEEGAVERIELVGGEIEARSPWQMFWMRFRADRVAMVSAGFIVLLVLVAVLGAGFPALARSMGWDVDPNLVVGAPSLVILLILLPWWALWLRAWLGHAAPPEAEPAAS